MRHTRTYALIATDSRSEYGRGKLKRRPLTACLRMKLFLKYRLQADSVCSASDQTEAVFLSSVTRLHCYVCLASACLVRVFVLMYTQHNMLFLALNLTLFCKVQPLPPKCLVPYFYCLNYNSPSTFLKYLQIFKKFFSTNFTVKIFKIILLETFFSITVSISFWRLVSCKCRH